MLAPKMRPGGVPHRALGVIFEVFEVLSDLEGSGRVLKAVLHSSWAVWQSPRAALGEPLEECLGVLVRSSVSCWRPRWQRNPENIEKSVAPRGRRFQNGFFMVFVSKISSPGDINSLNNILEKSWFLGCRLF